MIIYRNLNLEKNVYNIVKSVGIRSGINKRWELVNLSLYSVTDLYNVFRSCYVELTQNDSTTSVYLNIEDIKATYGNYIGTFADLLIVIDQAALPTITTMPIINTKVARYRDAFQAGYKVEPVHPLHGTNVPMIDRTAVMLTRNPPSVDYAYFRNHCLVSVNGFYHMTDTDGASGVLVYGANTSLLKSNQNNIGIYSFDSVCSLKLVPIRLTMLYKHDNNELYSSSTYIDVGENIIDKCLIVVIGGYFHAPDSELISKVSANCIKVDFKNYPFLDRYYESIHYMDLSSLNISTTNKNLLQADMSELLGDHCVSAYMTLPQSFIAIMDTPEVFVNRQYIRRSNIYGMYTSYMEPRYPLVTGIGRHPEYISTLEHGQYAVNVQDNTVQNRIYNTVNPNSLRSVSDYTLPDPPADASSGYLLEIGRDV